MKRKATNGDESAAKKLSKIVHPENTPLFEAILALDSVRQTDQGRPLSTPVTEIKNYCDCFGFGNSFRMRLINAMRLIDREVKLGNN